MTPNALKIEYRDIIDLKPHKRSLRTHNRSQVRKAASLLRRYGQVLPIIVDQDGVIIDGHLVWTVMKELSHDEIAVVVALNRDPTEIKALRLALNRLPDDTEWDRSNLKLEFQELLDIDFSLELTGFDDVEIDILLAIDPENDSPEDNPLECVSPDDATVSQIGDLWLLGNHRLLCGSVLDGDDVARLMVDDKAQMVISDPPYNVSINGHVCGSGAIKHDEFAMASGEMSSAEFTQFLTTSLGNMARFSCDGSLGFIFMDWRHMRELLIAGAVVYDEFKNLCVWNKNNGGMGSFYRSKHELVFVYKIGSAPHVNNILLGKHGRNRTNVWNYAGVNSLRPERLEELKMHPTVKPVAMIADAILDASNRNGIVLDGFGGSGTTLMAAEQTGRRAHTIEIASLYVDVAIQRWQKVTGDEAVHAETNLTFRQIAERRSELVEDGIEKNHTPEKEEAANG